MDKNDILDYVTETPGNTNRAVLGSMLDSMGGGGSDSNTIIVTVSSPDPYTTVASMTSLEILDAMSNGKIIVMEKGGTLFPLIDAEHPYGKPAYASFVGFGGTLSDLTSIVSIVQYTIGEDGTVTTMRKNITTT